MKSESQVFWMPNLHLLLPRDLDGNSFRAVVGRFINGCVHGLPNTAQIDFSQLGFIRPAGVTFLSNFVSWLHHRGVRVEFLGYYDGGDAIRFLDDSLFFQQHLGYKLNNLACPRATTRPLVHAHHEQSQAEVRGRFIPWLSNCLGVPRASLSDLQVCLLELFNNIQDHSTLEIGCLFAQHFPRVNEVAVAIADFGIGIPSAVQRIHPHLSHNAAIIKATERGFSSGTRPRNMGEGLSLLLDIIVGRYGGRVGICSLEGAVNFSLFHDQVLAMPLPGLGFCPGTTIDIWLRTDILTVFDEEPEELEW